MPNIECLKANVILINCIHKWQQLLFLKLAWRFSLKTQIIIIIITHEHRASSHQMPESYPRPSKFSRYCCLVYLADHGESVDKPQSPWPPWSCLGRFPGAIQPSHPLLSPSPSLSLFHHQGLFQWVGSSHQVSKVLGLQFQHQSFQCVFRVNSP